MCFSTEALTSFQDLVLDGIHEHQACNQQLQTSESRTTTRTKMRELGNMLPVQNTINTPEDLNHFGSPKITLLAYVPMYDRNISFVLFLVGDTMWYVYA